jgi:beta-phosphoglucomutase-like phosphatase (HAD superfamily)
VFEDAPSGIASAKSAGMKVVALEQQYLPAEEAAKADLSIYSFSDISFAEVAKLFA